MSVSLVAWGMWLLRHQAELPEIVKLGQIAYDKSGKYTFAQQIDALIGILNIVKTIESDAPVHIFGAGLDDELATTEEVEQFNAASKEADEKYGTGIITAVVIALVAEKLKNLILELRK